MSKSSKQASRSKPKKPHPDFPLFPHATGRWAKKVKGKLHYFGKVEGDEKGQAALDLWLEQKDDLLAGRKPRAKDGGLALEDLCDLFMERKEHLLDNGEIVQATFDDYHRSCTRVLTVFGKRRLVVDLLAEDFAKLRENIAKSYGLVRMGNEIQRIRSVFKFGYDEGLIDRPIRYGQGFNKPNRRAMREAANRRAARMFEAEEIREILDAADVHMKAMIFLGVNCGFGNHDVGTLPLDAVDLDGGWIDYPRPKTAVRRRCPLWPETVVALRASLTKRKEPTEEEHSGLFFITKYGGSWAKDVRRGPLTTRMRRLLKDLGLHAKGRGFYALRHVLETIGGESRDQPALDLIMGHVDDSMAATYRERISDERLQAVVDHVHDWLFDTPGDGSDHGEDDQAGDDRQADDRPRLRVVG